MSDRRLGRPVRRSDDFSRDAEPELYKRYLAIVLDGLKHHREAADPLPVAALDLPTFMEVMANWSR